MSRSTVRTGLDVGGTKIEAAVLNARGDVVARHRVAMPAEGYAACLDAVVGLVGEVETMAGAQASGLGIGTPGSISPVTGLMRNANTTCLVGEAFDRDVGRRLGRDVVLDNDANCFVLAEAQAGAGRGNRCVFGVIIGTGIGGGIVVEGQVLAGRNAICGEWGHNPLPWPTAEELPGPVCDCGWESCIEAWCSGPGLRADHLRITGSDLPVEMIAEFASAGEMTARDTLQRHTDRLARALAVAVNLLDPDVIVLGGGLSNLAHLYGDLPKAMSPRVFSDRFVTPIVRHELGDSAGVIGAAWLCPTEDDTCLKRTNTA